MIYLLIGLAVIVSCTLTTCVMIQILKPFIDDDTSCDKLYTPILSREPKEIVQVFNPKTKRYIKIDKANGTILAHKKTPGAYKGVPIIDSKAKK